MRWFIAVLYLSAIAADADLSTAEAQRIITATGFHGGLIVHVGCGDGKLTAAFHASGRTIQGLEADLGKVAAARRYIRSLNLGESVSVVQWRGGTLPYIDNLVNLLVINASTRVPEAEMMRVLAPLAVAYVEQKDGSWRKIVKPWPEEIDEWTHYLHGPDNNAVANDTTVGPPRHMQWRSGPIWGRHHGAEKKGNPTVKLSVSSGGRIFSLVDQTETSDMRITAKWTVVAQDAFNGLPLWVKEINTGKYKYGLQQIWRQLIAGKDRVYTAYGKDRVVRVLNAGTGEAIKTIQGTEGMVEMIKTHRTLLVLCRNKSIVAFEPGSGKALWTWKPGGDSVVEPLTLAAADGKVFAKTTNELVCLSEAEGSVQWKVSLPGPKKKPSGSFKETVFYPGKLLVSNDVVLCAYGGNDPQSLKKWVTDHNSLGHNSIGGHRDFRKYGGTLGAFEAKDGRRLWETTYMPHLQNGPGEAYIIDGHLWLGPFFDKTYDLHTGKVKTLKPIAEQLWTSGHHYRCYPGKATSNYIITGKRGVELIDMHGSNHSRNNWVRGTCQVGITPCNGLIYAPPHSCGCYMEARLWGFWALAGERAQQTKPATERLEKGKAYDGLAKANLQVNKHDWWTYRGSTDRSGATTAVVPSGLKRSWRTRLGGRLSAVTVANGKVFVAQVDTCTVHALDLATGRELWAFTADGRIDSPPTIVGDFALFGSHDGCVYALRTADGGLAWRFLAAPTRLNSMDRGHVESVWPVYGSVLYQNGVVYAAAGRSSYLDGGITVYGLNPRSGAVVCQTKVATDTSGAMEPPGNAAGLMSYNSQNWSDYKTKLAADRSDSFAMAGATNDILCGDSDSVYLRTLRFDGRLRAQDTQRQHLFSTSGLLDDWEHNRSYWVLGTGQFHGIPVAYPWIIAKKLQAPSGVMLAFDDTTVWSVQRNNRKKGDPACRIVAMPRPKRSQPDFSSRGSKGKPSWSTATDIRPRALLHAADFLFVGGMPLANRSGNQSGHIRVIACNNGKPVASLELPSAPVWDGLAAASGRLIVSCTDGSIVCLDAK